MKSDLLCTVWFRCKGCNALCCYWAYPGGSMPIGSVGHGKPVDKLNVPNSTGCALYNRCEASEFWALHEDAPRVEPPEGMNQAVD